MTIARLALLPLALLATMTNVSAREAREVGPPSCTERARYQGPVKQTPAIAPLALVLSDAPLAADDGAALDTALAAVRNRFAAPAITAAVLVPGKGIWQATHAPADTPVLFWASAGKLATAVVVLQLVEEKRISLEDRVSSWIEGVPHGDLITIRDLLMHTSGLYSANEDEHYQRNLHFLDLQEQIEIARRHGAYFCPGAAWRYSNTGYSLLGEIVRQVDGRSIDKAITDRFITPLDLKSMRALEPGGEWKGVAAPARPPGAMIEPSWPGAAGPLASDAADMARFLGALLGGHLLKAETTAAMIETLYPMFDGGTFYGVGMMLFEVQDKERTIRWIGHAGGVPGANAIVGYSPADAAIVAVAMTGDGSAAAAANYLLKTLAGTPTPQD